MTKKGIQPTLEILCKLLIAFGIVFLILGIIQMSGFPNVIKGMIGIVVGMLFMIIGNFMEEKASPKAQRFFSLFIDDSPSYRSNNKTTNKQTSRYRPIPPYPHEKAKHNHQSPNEAEHTTKSPLENPTKKIHRHLLCSYLTGLYHLFKSKSTKNERNRCGYCSATS